MYGQKCEDTFTDHLISSFKLLLPTRSNEALVSFIVERVVLIFVNVYLPDTCSDLLICDELTE